jgi:ubiquinone/menaquinone biosynthesis C-methylase UbiE
MGAEKVGKRYRGKGAWNYESKRAGKKKWVLENNGVEYLLPNGIKNVLDVPVGTGRFYPSYNKRNLEITGLDTSPDMLKEAEKKGITDLKLGSILDMPFEDKQFDVAVCVRLFGWFEPDEVFDAMKELARVADVLIIGIRTNQKEAFCKSNSLWNHFHPDFLEWVEKIGYEIDDFYDIGNNGNIIYRMVKCE